MPQISEFYDMAASLSPLLDSRLSTFFYEYMKRTGGIEVQSQMMEWKNEAKKCPQFVNEPSFQNYIWFILSSSGYTQAKEPRDKFYEQRRQAKIYWRNIAKKEKHNGFADGMIRRECESYFGYLRISNNNAPRQFDSEEQFFNEKYDEVESWGTNSATNLIDFPMLFQLKDKKIADYLYKDCAFQAYDYILKNFYADAISGFVTKYTLLTNQGVFAYSSANKEMDVRVDKDAIKVFDESSETYNTVVHTSAGDYEKEVRDGTQGQIIELYKREHNLNFDLLNSTDNAVLTKIYNSLTLSDVQRQVKTMDLESLVKAAVPGKPRKEGYLLVLECLRKLSIYSIERKIRDPQGNVKEYETFDFLKFKFKTDDDDSEGYIETSVNTGADDKDGEVMQELTSKDFEKMLSSAQHMSKLKVDIKPGSVLTAPMLQSINDKNEKILTSMLKDGMPPKVKAMLQFLNRERTAIYPNEGCNIDYSEFVSKLRIVEKKKKRMTDAIESSISYLKEHNTLVKDYSMGAQGVEITFFPMDKTDRHIYSLEQGDVV